MSNSEIDQTIDDVVNGKGEITVNDSSQTKTKLQPQQPSTTSQLVWVQNGTVTTKTWLSPLYQKQQVQQQSVYDPIGSNLTHQDVVNIAQQVVFPTNTEQNQINTVLPPPPPLPTIVTTTAAAASKATTNTTKNVESIKTNK